MNRMERVKYLENKIGKPEGKGTHRSIGSDKRLKSLIERIKCRQSGGKACRRR